MCKAARPDGVCAGCPARKSVPHEEQPRPVLPGQPHRSRAGVAPPALPERRTGRWALVLWAGGVCAALAACVVPHTVTSLLVAFGPPDVVIDDPPDAVVNTLLGGPMQLLLSALTVAVGALVALGVLVAAHAVCAALFLARFYRAGVNAALLDPAGRRFRQRWALVGWLLPVVHLWLPKAVANDIWRASTPSSTGPGARRLWPGILHAWWALWVLWQFCAAGAWLTGGTGWFLSAEVSFICSALLAVLVVLRLTSLQSRRLRYPD